jgi:beta-lactamase regulating signal transducer with metallopeptidase domain
MMLNVLIEAAARSLVLALAVGLVLWIGRVRSPRLQMTAWTLVLAGALLMPFLMRWRAIEVHPPRRVAATVPVLVRTLSIPRMTPPSAPASKPIDWRAIEVGVYTAVATVLLGRLLTGLCLTCLLWRRARRIHEPWATGCDLRESEDIGAPATFGSSILLPVSWRDWDALKLRAVIAHELSHVAWRDFFVQLTGKVHVAVFWFSPMSWWLQNRLIHLAEAASDAAAMETVASRTSYAEILLGLACKAGHPSAAVAMARPATVKLRVERILSGAILPANPNWKRYVQVVAIVAGVAAVVAGSSIRAQQELAPAPAPAARPQAPKTDEVHNWWWTSEKNGDAYAIVSGDSLTMSGSEKDARRARAFRGKIAGDYLWFEHDGKEYLITDPATVKRAQELFRPQEELGRKQAELGEQQARLGEQQALLGQRQAEASIRMPALDGDAKTARDQLLALESQLSAKKLAELARSAELLGKLENELRLAKGKDLTQETLSQLQAEAAEVQSRFSEDVATKLSELQSQMGDLQSRLGDLQSRVGEKQSAFGQEQSLLGEKQSELGDQQSRLGEAQSRLAEKASRQLRQMLEDCVRNGLAHAAH